MNEQSNYNKSRHDLVRKIVDQNFYCFNDVTPMTNFYKSGIRDKIVVTSKGINIYKTEI